MLLPDPQRRGEIHFVFAKSLPYSRRLKIAIVLLVAGFLLQVTVNSLLGALVLLAASLLTIVKGYTNRPESMTGKREWRAGEKTQLQKIADIARKAKSWDQSAIDITCGFGCLTLLLGGAALLGLSALVSLITQAAWLGPLVVLDAAVLLLPHWVTGVRRILTNAPLTVKVDNLLYVHSLWEANQKDNEAMTVQIEMIVVNKDEEIPVDAKLILQLPSLGNSFLGMQVQVVLNNVQGADYPYVYCVLVARPELNMQDKLSPTPPAGVVAEWKDDQGVKLLIVRQMTTKDSGYHTDRAAISRIFTFAHGQARQLLPASPPPPLPS